VLGRGVPDLLEVFLEGRGNPMLFIAFGLVSTAMVAGAPGAGEDIISVGAGA